jgi:plastocyanin
MRRAAYFLAAGLALGALGAVGTALSANTVDVSQKGKEFNPDEITVDRGTTVRFVNDDTVAHNVYTRGDGLEFNLGTQAPGDVKEVSFDKAGSFQILCAIHPKMSLTVNVK